MISIHRPRTATSRSVSLAAVARWLAGAEARWLAGAAPRRCRVTLGVAALALAGASTLPASCRGACRTLEHCDETHCAVLSALQLGHEQPQPVGCVEKERNNAPGVVTYARAGDGTCWIFPTTLVAAGFTADDSCRP